MNIFQKIKESVTTRQAAEVYGLKVNRNGMVCCPFHNDKHPSMKVDKGFYCFACGAKGDVIHFVERLFGISPYEAASKLAEDFRIPIESKTMKSKHHVNKKRTQRKSPHQLKQEFEKWEKYCIRILSDYLHLLEDWKQQYAPRHFEDEWKDEFAEACKCREITAYYLDILLSGALEERVEFIKNKGEEMKQIEKRMEQYRRRNDEAGGDGSQVDGIRRCS